jgi:hypothetical protein
MTAYYARRTGKFEEKCPFLRFTQPIKLGPLLRIGQQTHPHLPDDRAFVLLILLFHDRMARIRAAGV